MRQARTGESAMKNETIVERTGDRELTVTRTFDARAHIVFDAWTKPELLKRWWAPKSFGVSLFECEQDLRVGGAYRFASGATQSVQRCFLGGTWRWIGPHGWSSHRSMSGCRTRARSS